MKRNLLSFGILVIAIFYTSCEQIEPITKLTTLNATATGPITATAEGKIIELSSANHSEYGFVYSTSANPTIADIITELGNAKEGNYTGNITGLLPATLYYLRSYCIDGDTYLYGEEINFTTLGANVIFNKGLVLNITPTSALVTGVVTSDAGVTVTERGICWGTNQNPSTSDNHLVVGDGVGTFTIDITNLAPSTTYYFRAYAINLAGTFYSTELTFTTLHQGTLMDIESNIYKTVKIGNQEWMAENLKTTKYRNGNSIITGLDNTSWGSTAQGAYTIYPFSGISGIASNEAMITTYGILYNWYAVADSKNICPIGWRIPTDEDWNILNTFIDASGTIVGNKLKSCRQVNSLEGGTCATSQHPRWDEDATQYGTDDFGFSALPSGYCNENGLFIGIGIQNSYWSLTGLGTGSAWCRNLFNITGSFDKIGNDKNMGFSVRCIKE